MTTLADRLRHEILMARQHIYTVADPTPLESLALAGGVRLFIKREDLGPIHAYKWRGAYNRMHGMTAEELHHGVVTASAGNHAQGVALAARRLETTARIFMPLPTPKTKQDAVRRQGSDRVEIILTGDTYDNAADAALEDARSTGRVFVNAFDDLMVTGGQGTLADEIVMSGDGPFDVAFLQIGGGGMAAAVACWLKFSYPHIQIVGVEGIGQASMAAAFEAGKPVSLDYVDVFCDGTAVKRVGDLTYELCRELIDDLITVTNDEVCAAIQLLWERRRCVPEPAGAMGLAGILKEQAWLGDKNVIAIVCGANIDFGQLAYIARHAGIGAARRRYLRFEIDEDQGTLLQLLKTFLHGLNIVEFQYGKKHAERAWPIIGFEASPEELEQLCKRLRQHRVPFEDVTSQADVEFAIISYDSGLMKMPYFMLLEFHERPGALLEFLAEVSGEANLCYFNYSYSGERVGRALIGFEFDDDAARVAWLQQLGRGGHAYRSFREIGPEVLERIL